MAGDVSSQVTSGSNLRQIVVTAPGPQGPAGTAADGSLQEGDIAPLVSYRHLQGSVSTVWTVNHNLNFYPNVTVYDSAGSMVEGTVNHTNQVSLTITFSNPISGKAYIS
jgi:hypothetical protein